MTNGEIKRGEDQKSFWQVISSPRVVMAVAIILVIAGFVYLSSQNQKEQIGNTEEQAQTQTAEGGASEEQEVAGETTNNDEEIFTEKAERGEGITHLARRTLQKYLESRPELAGDLNAEQKIYIEDYLQNKTGNEGLMVGEERTFSKALIEEAIKKAKELTPKQIENLSRYVRK